MSEPSNAQRSCVKAVIFDLDGVLISSIPVHIEAFRRTFAEVGRDFTRDAYMELGAGVPRDVLIRRVMGDDIDGALFERMMARKVMHVEDVIRESGLVPIDGAEAFIRAVRDRGLKTAVATASRTPGLLLEGAGLGGLFEVVVDRNQVERAKPDPDIFLRASSLLGVDASDCIVIEDSPLGVEAGLRAGMRVIAMTTSEPRARLERAHAVVDGFGSIDLEQWLPGAKG